jgi:hypothetical protein
VVHSSFRIWAWDPQQGNWMDVRHKGDSIQNVHLPCSVTKTLHSIFSRNLVVWDSTLVTLKIIVHRLDNFEKVEPTQEDPCKDTAATSIHRSCIRAPNELSLQREGATIIPVAIDRRMFGLSYHIPNVISSIRVCGVTVLTLPYLCTCAQLRLLQRRSPKTFFGCIGRLCLRPSEAMI